MARGIYQVEIMPCGMMNDSFTLIRMKTAVLEEIYFVQVIWSGTLGRWMNTSTAGKMFFPCHVGIA